MSETLDISFQIIILAILSIIILAKPYIGVILSVASLPIVDILPSIPFLTSIVPLIGGITLVAYLFSRLNLRNRPSFQIGPIQYLGFLFIIWIFITNPQAAWSGISRNWVFTFVQLWVLAWMAGELFDTPQKQNTLMGVFAGITLISALFAIHEGKIGVDLDTSIRSEGLAGGANSAARYFVVALIFLVYLRGLANTGIKRLIVYSGMFILTFGVFMTVSRTGILLLFGAVGLMVLLPYQGRRRGQILFIFGASFLALWFLSDSILDILYSIFPSIAQGTDTVGVRYGFWQAGIRMFLDNSLFGVGIGRYPEVLPYYGWDLVPLRFLSSTAHNLYIALLSETGIVGFGLFMSMIAFAFHGYISAKKHLWKTDSILINFWIIVFIVMLIGGITKTDQADKLLWLVIGLSSYFYRDYLLSVGEKERELAQVALNKIG
jgi:O-antigen ligase